MRKRVSNCAGIIAWKGGMILDKIVNSILISLVDDVATTLVEFRPGEVGRYLHGDKLVETIIAGNVPKYHKFAVRYLTQGEYVRKYGEVIGVATQNIKQGCHVHEHNIASPCTDSTKA